MRDMKIAVEGREQSASNPAETEMAGNGGPLCGPFLLDAKYECLQEFLSELQLKSGFTSQQINAIAEIGHRCGLWRLAAQPLPSPGRG